MTWPDGTIQMVSLTPIPEEDDSRHGWVAVLRDITHPSFAINPDYLSYTVVLTDGRVRTGVLRTAERKLSIGDANGTITELDRSDVEAMQSSPVSTMPEGIATQLGPARMRDLMTFLLTPPHKFI